MSKIDVSGGIESHLKTGKPCQLPPSFIKRDTEEVSMKEIKLTQGKVALVDDEDYEHLSQWKWYTIKKRKNTFYAFRHSGKTVVSMHREIMKTPKELQVDHKDHDGLNNQKHNLRNCTQSQNNQNMMGYGRKYKGVSYIGNRMGYTAQICLNRKTVCLGTFKDETDAATAYNDAALKYFGEFACLNVIQDKGSI
jgi:hypothetical protein